MDEYNFDMADVRIDTFRTGSMLNKADSAVGVTHIPTGSYVFEDSFMGQHRNRKAAFQRLSEILSMPPQTEPPSKG